MRKQTINEIKKYLAVTIALFSTFTGLTSNEAKAQNGDWNNIATNAENVNLSNDVTLSGETHYRENTANTVINGGGHTISGTRTDSDASWGQTNPQLITNSSGAGLIINNTTMTKGGGTSGGAILNNGGSVQVNNSNFTENTTDFITSPGPEVGNGGVISNTGAQGGVVEVNNSTFSGNGVYRDDAGNLLYITNDGNISTTASDSNSLMTSMRGGAIYNGTNSVTETVGENVLKVNESTFTNNYAQNGGAIYNAGTATIENSTFTGNKAVSPLIGSSQNDGNNGRGGAIANSGGQLTVTNSTFTENSATKHSGALYNSGGTVNIDSNVKFEANTAQNGGGAIGNFRGGTLNIEDTSFVDNKTTGMAGFGGAIYNTNVEPGSSEAGSSAILNINQNTTFSNNAAASGGGAIYNKSIAHVDGATFVNNGVTSDESLVTSSGGAIWNDGRNTESGVTGNMEIKNTTFESNYANSMGGAIFNQGELAIQSNTLFLNNGYRKDSDGNTLINSANSNPYITTRGGAIYNTKPNAGDSTAMTVDGATFQGNASTFGGGAVYNDEIVTISNSDFINNGITADGLYKTTNGGAIYNNDRATIIDSNFQNNQATNGGAIFGGAGSTTNLKSVNKDVYVGTGDNTSGLYDSIYLASNGNDVANRAVLNISANENRVVNINSTVTGSDTKGDVNINPDGETGKVVFNGAVSNTNLTLNNGTVHFTNDYHLKSSDVINLNGGTFSIMNGAVTPFQAGELNINNTTNIQVDVDLANQQMDNLLSDGPTSVNHNGGSLNVNAMQAVTDTRAQSVAVLFTDLPQISGNGAVTSDGLGMIQGPIYKYAVSQYYDDGSTGNQAGEYFIFNNMGNSDSSLIGSVASQMGFLLMDNLYRQSFANMDMTMLMTREQRMAMKMRNKYASTDDVIPGLYQPSSIGEERDGLYIRPFSNFENVPLSGGPKVSNVSYGTLIGGESDIIELKHGWDANYSIFGAYHGSHQAYNGVSMWQNGGTLGAVGTLYKGNFFTGLTANVGASGVAATSLAGREEFPMLMTGVASKTGYNFEFKNGKYIVQPSFMASYTFVNVFDYRNASGLQVDSDPLHVIELIPGIKFIMNTKNGWQPYLGVNMTWNILDKSKFRVADVAVSRLSVDPFVEYGVGVQKRVGDRFTGFGQAMLRNGGRNGIALTFGFRWALGD